MNKIVPILLGIVVLGLGAVLVAQQQTTSLLHRKLQLLEEEAGRLRAQLAETKQEATALRTDNEKLALKTERVETAAPASADATTPGTASAHGAKKGPNEMMKGIAQMFTDPEMKKVMRSQQAMGMRMIYGDLAKELGLTPEEASQIMELLTDRQMALTTEGMKLMSGEQTSPDALAKQSKAVEAAKEEWDKQLKNVLGPDRFAQFEEYEKGMGDRMMMTQLKSQMSATGMTLTDDQSSGILQIMKEERSKTPKSVFDPTNKNVGAQIAAMRDDAQLEAFLEQQKELNRRVLDRAHTVLSPDQVDQFRKSMEQMAEMQQMGIKMSRQMFGGGDRQPPPAPVQVSEK